MKRHLLISLFVLTVAGSLVRADMIDDAEAKKRGVPVEVITLEHQLAASQARVKELEVQIAVLQKQLAAAPHADNQPAAAATGADPAARLEALRTKEITRVEAELNQARRAPVNTVRVNILQDRIKDLRNPKVPYLPSLDRAPVVGDIFYISDIRVLQVQNDSEAIVEVSPFDGTRILGSSTVWLQGVNAKQWTDNRGVGLHQLVEFTGTKKYDSNAGPTTVLLAKTFGSVMP